MLDTSCAYAVDGYPGIAWRLLGYATAHEPVTYLDADPETGETVEVETGETEEVEDTGRVRAVMIGDNRPHEFDVDDLTALPEDGYCRGCGQTACGHDRALLLQ